MSKKPALVANWRNRIIGNEMMKVDQLMANPSNFRIHPEAQQQALAGSIDSLGYAQTVTVTQNGMVVDGHLRVQMALRSGVTEIPVTVTDLTDEEADLMLMMADPIAQMASHDKAKLEELMHSVQSDDERVQQMIADLAKREGIAFGEIQEDAEPQIDRAAELNEKWQVKTGDLWQIGEHRLLCGDSTKREDVDRVMQGEKARLVWTDPPYGVNYGEKLDAANPMGYRVRTIENDDLPPDQLEEFLRSALKNVADVTLAGAAIYVACPPGTPLPALIASFGGSGFEFRWGLIWLKDQIVLSRADYHFKHENILYGWKPDGAHYFADDRKQTSVFEYPRPKKSEEHPTMKPIELIQNMVRNSSEKGDIVIDVFGGSGSTMLACENEQRKSRLVELSSNYCAVILERMQDAFGITGVLVQS